MQPEFMLCVIPSRLGVGEELAIKVKVCGPVHPIECAGGWNTWKPRLRGPFNLNVQRGIQYMDNCLPEWRGTLDVDGAGALDGDARILFDGAGQGAFEGDTRPIKVARGFRWTRPGFHFVKLTDPDSGVEACSNPVLVTEQPPAERIFWGDPHWQTFFSDGIRCPEELYAFARDEGFLDFGALADHVEGVTDCQWDYFQAVTNLYNAPGRFVTLIGQEWTNHDPRVGAPGHRNVYYRGAGGPVLRSTAPDCNTLPRLWAALDGREAVAIPHHSANKVMGVDWSQGWNPEYEKAVEIYSVWGSSEKSAADGNPCPIRSLGGEVAGRHVVDALKLGYRFGFVGGGDIHDGRPGDDLHDESYPPKDWTTPRQGLTAVRVPALTREHVYDAIKARCTYAATRSRIYLDVALVPDGPCLRLDVQAASEDGIREAAIVRNGADVARLLPDADPRVVCAGAPLDPLAPGEFCYVRVTTNKVNMAWSSPFYPTPDP